MQLCLLMSRQEFKYVVDTPAGLSNRVVAGSIGEGVHSSAVVPVAEYVDKSLAAFGSHAEPRADLIPPPVRRRIAVAADHAGSIVPAATPNQPCDWLDRYFESAGSPGAKPAAGPRSRATGRWLAGGLSFAQLLQPHLLLLLGDFCPGLANPTQ